MRVKNISTHAVDAIGPGAEGEVIDNRANRALLGVVLEALEDLPAEPPRKARAGASSGAPSDARGPSEAEYLRADREVNRLRDLLGERDATILSKDERIAELEARVRELEAGTGAEAPASPGKKAPK